MSQSHPMSSPPPGVRVTAPNASAGPSSSSSSSTDNRHGSPSSLETVQPISISNSTSNANANLTSTPNPPSTSSAYISDLPQPFTSTTYSPPSNSNQLPSTGASPNSSPNSDGTTPIYRPGHRKRSSSIITVEKIETSHEEMLDQAAGFNANADWVNYKGAWVIHIVLILLGKILLDVVPGMEQDISWTLVNLGYIGLSYLMFHYVTGTPFDSNGGAYDELTLWEQIDEGAQYTPAKKWLTSVPIGVFLIATHYTKFSSPLFAVNFAALLWVLFPKLPLLHRLRFKIMPTEPSQPSTPIRARSPAPPQNQNSKRAY